MVRCFLLALLASLMGLSCAKLTEYDLSWESSLRVYSPEDLSLVASFPEVTAPRSMMIVPGMVFVASTEGIVYSFDAETRELIAQHQVGPASASGYGRMVFSPTEGTAYLIGATGKILELSIPDCEVLDEFSLGTSPFDLEVTAGNPGYLWVADASSNTIYQVRLSDNLNLANTHFYGTQIVQCMEGLWGTDTLIVGTSDLVYRVEVMAAGGIRKTYLNITGTFTALGAIANSAYLTAVRQTTLGMTLGMLEPYANMTVPTVPYFTGTVSVTGTLHRTADARDYNHSVVLSYLGDLTCRLSLYHYWDPEGIVKSVDIQGYPLDMQVSGGGDIYVLSY